MTQLAPVGGRTTRLQIAERYARLYLPLAVGTVIVSAMDLYEDITITSGTSTFRRQFGSVWWMVANDGLGVAALGAVLLVALVAVLLVAGLSPRPGLGLPVAITGLGVVLAVMVLNRTGIRSPVPELADGGQAALAVAVMVIVIGGTHTLRAMLTPAYPWRPEVVADPVRRQGGAAAGR